MKVTEDEVNKLKDLYKSAQNTPYMLIGNNNLDTSAWDCVRNYMDELAKKYNVASEPGKWGVKFSTREIFYV